MESNWWLNPLKFVDETDLLLSCSNAVSFLEDLGVDRPTEFSAFLRLFLAACHKLDHKHKLLTIRQDEAVRLAREAVRKGQRPTRYVAQRLNISHRAVQRLLNRAGNRIDHAVSESMFAFQSNFHVLNKEQRGNWSPNEEEIRSQMARMSRICAGCGGTTRGMFSLCWTCGQRFGHTREEWDASKRVGEPAPGKWLLPEARRLDAQHRRDAINELYRAHGYDEEQIEEALEAAS